MREFDEEFSDERQGLCERCRKFVSLSELKYVPKGNDSKMALCTSCLKNFNVPPGSVKKAPADAPLSSVKRFLCSRCNYKFRFNTSKDSALRCPYCGRTDKIIDEDSRSAERILKGGADF
ncbi:hypothetical protein JW826_05875 [Candidatus Woesearchaeota archaeon]|nr:hypothetical protein [Candidatus Woesearchaeota archaeon]